MAFFVARRRRAAIASSVRIAIEGCSVSKPRYTHSVSANSDRSVVAVTVAVRGPPSSSAISPKKSPAFRWLMRLPPIVTSASPSSITNRPAPGSPSLATTEPGACCTGRTAFAIVWRSFFEQPEKIGTRDSRSTTSLFATLPPRLRRGDATPRSEVGVTDPSVDAPARPERVHVETREPDRRRALDRGLEVFASGDAEPPIPGIAGQDRVEAGESEPVGEVREHAATAAVDRPVGLRVIGPVRHVVGDPRG